MLPCCWAEQVQSSHGDSYGLSSMKPLCWFHLISRSGFNMSPLFQGVLLLFMGQLSDCGVCPLNLQNCMREENAAQILPACKNVEGWSLNPSYLGHGRYCWLLDCVSWFPDINLTHSINQQELSSSTKLIKWVSKPTKGFKKSQCSWWKLALSRCQTLCCITDTKKNFISSLSWRGLE